MRLFIAALALATAFPAAAIAGGATILPGCFCSWFNGPTATPSRSSTGLLSHEGGGAGPGVKAADDFYLDISQVHRLDTISVDLATSSVAGLVKARLEIYDDCDGRPGRLLYTFTRSTVEEVGPLGFDNLRRVRHTFVASQQGTILEPARPIALRGGTYWLSTIGLTDNLCSTMNMCDQTFWLPVEGPIKGSTAHKVVGVFGDAPGTIVYPDSGWTPSDICCAGCIDLAFTVCATPCKIILDQGGPDLTRFAPSISGSGLLLEARTADDLVVPLCEDQELCYVRGYIATNCNPPRARLDVYDAACTLPATFSPPTTFDASRLTDTGRTITVEGRVLKVYAVDFWDFQSFGFPLTLNGGRNYWLSIYAVGSGSVSERGYALGAKRCDIPQCTPSFRQFNPAAISGALVGITDQSWRPVRFADSSTFDLGLTVAIRPVASVPPGGVGGSAACPSDVDGNGRADVSDIFGFLTLWFAGCP